jgi:hypothetical protein
METQYTDMQATDVVHVDIFECKLERFSYFRFNATRNRIITIQKHYVHQFYQMSYTEDMSTVSYQVVIGIGLEMKIFQT